MKCKLLIELYENTVQFDFLKTTNSYRISNTSITLHHENNNQEYFERLHPDVFKETYRLVYITWKLELKFIIGMIF